MSISEVTPQTLDHVWEQLLPEIERGLSHGQGDSTSPDEVLHNIRMGDMAMWAMHKGEDIQAGIVLSAVNVAPGERKVFVELLAGRNMAEWADELEQLLKDFKGLVGAKCVEASCRPGLARYLGKRGWRTKALIMEIPE